jgi:hypothetical protein
MAIFAIQPAPLARQHGSGLLSRCNGRKCFSSMKDLENPAAAVDEFFAQQACLDGRIDSAALGFPAKPPHEVPRKAVVQSGRFLRCRCHP